MAGLKDPQNPIDSAVKPIINLMIGPYLRVEMIVTSPQESSVYHIPTGGTFQKTPLSSMCFTDDTHDFLYVPVTPDEEHRIQQTCDACVVSRKGYNYRDVILHGVPFRQPEERSIFQTSQLYCAQSVVLILRECLVSTHHLARILWGFHSRMVTPNTLYEEIAQFCVVMGASTILCGICPVNRQEDPVSATPVQPSSALKSSQTRRAKPSKFPDPQWDKW